MLTPPITSTSQYKPTLTRKPSKLLTVSGSPAKLRAMGSRGASPTTTDDGPGPLEGRGAGVWLEERPLAQGSTKRRPAGVGSNTRAPAPGLAHMPTGQEAIGPILIVVVHAKRRRAWPTCCRQLGRR